VIINRHVKNHITSRNTLIRLYDKYLIDLNVVIVIIKNHGEKKDINTVEIDFLRDQVHNIREIEENLYVYTKAEYTSGQLTEEQFEALTER
jgi:REP element-mobilizing transposase RayT